MVIQAPVPDLIIPVAEFAEFALAVIDLHLITRDLFLNKLSITGQRMVRVAGHASFAPPRTGERTDFR